MYRHGRAVEARGFYQLPILQLCHCTLHCALGKAGSIGQHAQTGFDRLPVLAGGAAGKMKGGRHLKYPENTPMANLLMTILDKAGIPQESVGDSTGFLSEV